MKTQGCTARFFLGLILFLITSQVTALCIGCGCSAQYSECLDAYSPDGFYNNCLGSEFLNFQDWKQGCCRALRSQCHFCGTAINICFSRASYNKPPETLPLEELTFEEQKRVATKKPIIDKFQSGRQLADRDYASLDFSARNNRVRTLTPVYLPLGRSTISDRESQFQSAVGVQIEYDRIFTDHWSLNLSGGFLSLDYLAEGNNDLRAPAEILVGFDAFPALFSARYHSQYDRPADVFVGAGLGYLFYNSRIARSPALETSGSGVGVFAEVGGDFQLGQLDWGVAALLRYGNFDLDVPISSLSFDHVSLAVGLTHRF